MSPEDAAAVAAMMSAEQPLKAEAPDVKLTLNETWEKKPIDAQLSQEDAAALACFDGRGACQQLYRNSAGRTALGRRARVRHKWLGQ